MKKNLVIFSLFPLLFFANSGHAYSETTTLSPDGGMEIQIIYPDYVLIELGGNDALRGYPPIRIKNNLKNIILKIKENDAIPLLMQIRIPPNYGQKYVLAFEGVFKEISQEEEISLIPFMLNNVALDKSLMQRDGIHPNIKAQPIITKFLKENLLKFIE